MMRLSQIFPVILSLALVVAAVGCEEDGIRRYQVSHSAATGGESAPAAPAQAEGEQTPQRTLVAIFEQPQRTWFFKLSGNASLVAGEAERFRRFVRSVRFDGTEPSWDTPDPWQRGSSSSSFRYATLMAANGQLEIAVSRLGGTAGGLLQNINRWRRQIGLGPASEADLPGMVERIEVGDRTVPLVDMTGPGGSGSGGMGPPFAPGSAPMQPAGGAPSSPSGASAGADGGAGEAGSDGATAGAGGAASGQAPGPPGGSPDRPELDYEAPAGWREGEQSRFTVAAFEASTEAGPVSIRVTPLPGAAGTDLDNVNRWRRQAGAEPLNEQELEETLEKIEVDGQPWKYVDVSGSRGRIVVAFQRMGDWSWFFKLQGPEEAVERQKDAFEQFLRTVRFKR